MSFLHFRNILITYHLIRVMEGKLIILANGIPTTTKNNIWQELGGMFLKVNNSLYAEIDMAEDALVQKMQMEVYWTL